jgi:hypothetical protein
VKGRQKSCYATPNKTALIFTPFRPVTELGALEWLAEPQRDELFANLTSWKPDILVHGQIDSFRWLNFALMKAPGSLEQIIVGLGHPLGLH